MYKLFDLIRAIRAALQPYRVAIIWEGALYEHRAWTTRDALQWLAQYPSHASAWIETRSGALIAYRNPSHGVAALTLYHNGIAA